MKPVIGKRKNARGRIVGYSATLGPLTVHESTPEEASRRVEQEALSALERIESGYHFAEWHGHAYLIIPELYGWAYWLDVFSRYDYHCQCGGKTREEAEQNALHHLAQTVWTHDDDDQELVSTLPEAIRQDLLSWFTWQRGMKRLTAAGHSDQVARDILAGMRPDTQPAEPVTV